MSTDLFKYNDEREAASAAKVRALEALLIEKGVIGSDSVDTVLDHFEKIAGPFNGARIVARAWVDPAYKQRLLANTPQAIAELQMPWGKEGAELMAPEVKAKILDRPRAKEWAERPPPEPSAVELRKKMNAGNISDEEFLLRWNLDVKEIEVMKAAGAPREYLTASQPLVKLIDALSQRKDYRQIVIQKGDMVVSLNRGASPP